MEWSHALAPGANILLVEAANNGSALDDIAVPYAASQPGVSVVSMSFGSTEFSTESGLDRVLHDTQRTHRRHFRCFDGRWWQPGRVSGLFSQRAGRGRYEPVLEFAESDHERNWLERQRRRHRADEPQPSYQLGFVTQSSTQRTIPDVSLDANPSTGVTIYDSYNGGTSTPWEQIGGTSVSAPCWAALIAIANQGRNVAGLANLDGRSGTLPDIYNLPSSDFHDITSGSNGAFSAATGYDLVTGRGSPNAPLIVAGLAGTSVITGTVFSDGNSNGVQDSGEGGLAGWTVYDDLSNDGIYQPPAQRTVNSPNAPETIPAATTITSTTTVSGLVGGIIDLNVNLSITISRFQPDPDPHGPRWHQCHAGESQRLGREFHEHYVRRSGGHGDRQRIGTFTGSFKPTALYRPLTANPPTASGR